MRFMRYIFTIIIFTVFSTTINIALANISNGDVVETKESKITENDLSCTDEYEGAVTVTGFESSRFFISSPCEKSKKPLIVFVNYLTISDADNAIYIKPEELIGVPRNDKRYTFKYLSNKFVSQGFSTLRYDLIGFGCKGKRFPIERNEKYSNGKNEFNPFCIRNNELMKTSRADITKLLNLVLEKAYEQKKNNWPRDIIFLMISANTIVVNDLMKLDNPFPTGMRFSGIGLTAAWSPGLDDFKWQKIGFAKNKILNCKEDESRKCISEAIIEIEKLDQNLAIKIKEVNNENNFLKIDEKVDKIINNINSYFDNYFKPILQHLLTSDTATFERDGIRMNAKAYSEYTFGNFDLLNSLPKKLYKIKTINSDTDGTVEFDNAKRLWLAAGLREQDFIRMSNVDHDLGTKNILQSNDSTQFDKVVKTLLEVAETMATELAAEPVETSK